MTPGLDGAEGRCAAVVVNPVRLTDPAAHREQIQAAIVAAGWKPPLWYETTPEETGRTQAAEAVRAGADVVFVSGGDGTVAACAAALAGTGVPLALLRGGTGNLLATNLGLPVDLADCVEVGLRGADRRIDLGVLDGRLHFAVMAGLGFDAAMIADTSDALKRRLGWIAYVAAAVRHLGDGPIPVTFRLDDRPVLRRRVRTLLVANVGRIQGGVRVLPGAEPDDGKLDVLVVSAPGPADVLRVMWRLLRGRRESDSRAEFFRAARVRISTRTPTPLEIDGDALEAATRHDIRVAAASLVVRVPRVPAPSPPDQDDGLTTNRSAQRVPEQGEVTERGNREAGTADASRS